MQNFSDVVQCFLARDAVVRVKDATELEAVLAQLLSDESRRARLGQNALKVVRENLGAVERTVETIVRHLEGGELYTACRNKSGGSVN